MSYIRLRQRRTNVQANSLYDYSTKVLFPLYICTNVQASSLYDYCTMVLFPLYICTNVQANSLYSYILLYSRFEIDFIMNCEYNVFVQCIFCHTVLYGENYFLHCIYIIKLFAQIYVYIYIYVCYCWRNGRT